MDLTLFMKLLAVSVLVMVKMLCSWWFTGKCVQKVEEISCYFHFTVTAERGVESNEILDCLFLRGCCFACSMYSSLLPKFLSRNVP